MSKYTTQLRFICESFAGLTESQGENNVETIINNSWDKIFTFNFPLYEASHKEELCKKILFAYYTREIAFETYGLWKLKLQSKLFEIMPYYNELYKLESLDYNPIQDTMVTTTHVEAGNDNRDISDETETNTTTNVESSSNASSNSTTTTNATQKYSDTPQGSIDNLVDGTYLTNATINDTTVASEGGTEGSTNDSSETNTKTTKMGTDNTTKELNYTTTVSGKSGQKTYAEMIMEARKAIINIDSMIIAELSDLFMNLW